MFRPRTQTVSRSVVWAFSIVLALSLAAGGVTIWLIQEVHREQEIIDHVLGQLSPATTSSLKELPGELKWQFWLSLLVLFNGVAMIVALVVLARAYHASQTSLQDIKSLATDILASMDQSVITTDHSGIVTSLNPRAQFMYDITYDRVDKPIESLLVGDDQLAVLCRHVLRSREAVHDRDIPFRRNGSMVFYRADCCPLHDAYGRDQGTVLYIRDVTERVLVEDRLRRMERYMGLGSLAAGLHHEIKNPLGALSLHVQLLDERLEGLERPDDVAEMLGVLKTEVIRISGVLENFRSFASVSTLRNESTQLTALITNIVQLVKPQAEIQKVTMHVEQAESVPEFLIDPGKIKQVLLNLVVNSLEAMPDGGTLVVRLSRQGEHCLLEVQDTGSGIPENVRRSVFDPYFTTKSEGTGMGLALCEKIIRQHNGQLDFETGTQWTTFRIRLPLHQPADNQPDDTLETTDTTGSRDRGVLRI